MVQPLSKPKIIKKFGHKKFKRHQHDRKIAVKVRPEASGSWLRLCSGRTCSHTVRLS